MHRCWWFEGSRVVVEQRQDFAVFVESAMGYPHSVALDAAQLQQSSLEQYLQTSPAVWPYIHQVCV